MRTAGIEKSSCIACMVLWSILSSTIEKNTDGTGGIRECQFHKVAEGVV